MQNPTQNNRDPCTTSTCSVLEIPIADGTSAPAALTETVVGSKRRLDPVAGASSGAKVARSAGLSADEAPAAPEAECAGTVCSHKAFDADEQDVHDVDHEEYDEEAHQELMLWPWSSHGRSRVVSAMGTGTRLKRELEWEQGLHKSLNQRMIWMPGSELEQNWVRTGPDSLSLDQSL